MSKGGKLSFCSGVRVGRNEGTTAERSRDLLQQIYLLKPACHQKHSREKARYCLWNSNWKGVRGEILWLSWSLGWLDTALNDLWYFHCVIPLQFASLRYYTWALQRNWQGTWLWLVIRSQMKTPCAYTAVYIHLYCRVYERDPFLVQQMNLTFLPSTALATLLQQEFIS